MEISETGCGPGALGYELEVDEAENMLSLSSVGPGPEHEGEGAEHDTSPASTGCLHLTIPELCDIVQVHGEELHLHIAQKVRPLPLPLPLPLAPAAFMLSF